MTTLIKILFRGQSTWKFFLGIILGFSFSIAVILCTIGIMDGFDETLRSGLQHSTGDLTLYSHEGFFYVDPELQKTVTLAGKLHIAPFIQTEGFVVSKGITKGLLVKGVDEDSFADIMPQVKFQNAYGLAVGKELATQLNVMVGDEVTLLFASGSKNNGGLPILKRFVVDAIVEHGIYLQDSRFAYVKLPKLQEVLGTKGRVNTLSLKIRKEENDQLGREKQKLESIEEMARELGDQLGPLFVVKPFWHDFKTLIEAVKVQKLTIGLVMQIIVVIAIFNVLAFLIYLSDRKAKELFLIQALGMSKKKLMNVWLMVIFIIWSGSCALSLAWTKLFNYLLQVVPIFKIPGDIYLVKFLTIKLGTGQIAFVFILAFLWVYLIDYFILRRKFRRRNIMADLKKEFG